MQSLRKSSWEAMRGRCLNAGVGVSQAAGVLSRSGVLSEKDIYNRGHSMGKVQGQKGLGCWGPLGSTKWNGCALTWSDLQKAQCYQIWPAIMSPVLPGLKFGHGEEPINSHFDSSNVSCFFP